MSATEVRKARVLTLPSDQDASGRWLGEEELDRLREAIQSGTLTSTKGSMVRGLEKRFAEAMGSGHAYACSSGTAAIHAAVAAIDPEPGDEIITTPITDMGALTPILYQGAIPVFADVDVSTCNVTAHTIQRCLSDRTRAIVVTHLFGCPCDMAAIMELARRHQLPVIEDCAQAFHARSSGQLVGTIGSIGCFSLQQGKHITAGEGGLVVTSDAELARRVFLFINKAWGYGDPQPDHYFLALNYRMSELQGAVALAQLDKLNASVQNRIRAAEWMNRRLQGVPGIETPDVSRGDVHTYWKYCLRVDEQSVPGGTLGLGKRLRQQGIACAPRYIQKPAFDCEIFRSRRTFGKSAYPFVLARPEALDYRRERFPGTYAALDGILVLSWNEQYTQSHLDDIAEAIEEAVGEVS